MCLYFQSIFMKKKFVAIILISFTSAILHAQINKIVFNKNDEDDNKVFTKVEIEAGANPRELAEHIKKKSQLPDSILKTIPAGAYKVSVEFIIDVHGNTGQVKAKNDPGFGLAERAENILRSYKGEWKPASQCGRLVKSYKTQSVVFIISD